MIRNINGKFCTVLWMICTGTALEMRCGIPGRAPNTNFYPSKDSYSVGDNVTYYCTKHKQIISTLSRRFCLSNGRWLGDIPICYETVPLNTTTLLTTLPTKDYVIDNDEFTCTAVQDKFDNYLKALLENPVVIAGLRLVFSPNDKAYIDVIITKENGEEIKCGSLSGNIGNVSSKDILCGTDAKAKLITLRSFKNNAHYFHLCEVKVLLSAESCLTPDLPLNSYGGNRRVSNGRVEYNISCNLGYELEGSSVVSCVRNGIWTPIVPVCVVKCKNIMPEIANGVLLVNSTTIDSVAVLQCIEGFRPLSDDRIFCLPSGNWSQASLNCALIQCEANPEVPHGTTVLLDNSNYLGSKIHIICAKGYFSRDPVIRECDRSGTWGQLHNACNEISCNIQQMKIQDNGQWLPFNESRSTTWGALRVLSCNQGYHLQGFPVVVQCLPNGSWSYTTASCQRIPMTENWSSEWTPNVIMLAAVAVGAGTAISILCLVTTCLILRKRHQTKNNTTIFHVGLTDISKSNATTTLATDDHYYTAPSYEEVNVYSMTKPRKPSSALPCLPPDADPVYAQPFEIQQHKTSKANQEDLYAAHIYAEPVDSKVLNTNHQFEAGMLSNVPKNSHTTFFNGHSSKSLTNSESLHWTVRFQNEESETADCEENIFKMGTLLRHNSIYLQSGHGNLTHEKCIESIQIIDNDLYEDRYFSNA